MSKLLFALLLLLCAPLSAHTENQNNPNEQSTSSMTEYKKPSPAELQKLLSPEQFHVTQKDGTERPFQNAYWDNKAPGIYVDVVTGEPLFSSLDKFDSGTGWPSFTKPLEPANMEFLSDKKIPFQTRTEVRSKHGDSHLGHVFNDGPGPDGKRFCMNSASLRFIPVEKLQEEGYGSYAYLFGNKLNSKNDAATSTSQNDTAILAGGCFWGMEEIIRGIPGVISTRVGYSGGTIQDPIYKLVSAGNTGHAESIEVVFNPTQLSYAELLRVFFRMHDPTTLNRQGNDRGTQYRSAIFYTNDEQRRVAEEVKSEVDTSKQWPAPVVTEITKAGPFYEAEDYHQDYLQKNPGGYTCHFLRE